MYNYIHFLGSVQRKGRKLDYIVLLISGVYRKYFLQLRYITLRALFVADLADLANPYSEVVVVLVAVAMVAGC